MLSTNFPIWILFQQLRRHGFIIGIEDYQLLQQAMRAGFGWSSKLELQNLCCALWAKSRKEKNTIHLIFNQLNIEEWVLPNELTSSNINNVTLKNNTAIYTNTNTNNIRPIEGDSSLKKSESPPATKANKFPPIDLDGVELPNKSYILTPQYPLTYREIAQALRRLRRPIREGVPLELDIQATISKRSRQGVVSPVVLIPRKKNRINLLLLVDQQGSMAPFNSFVGEFCKIVQQQGKFQSTSVYYFHDVPIEGADDKILSSFSNQLFPNLDNVIQNIMPITTGYIYTDREMLSLKPILSILKKEAVDSDVILISDGGAARGRYDTLRILDTIAFFKTLRSFTTRYIWLNPLPRKYWLNNTASQIARYIPMFPLTYHGLHEAINVLRGHSFAVGHAI